jgi:hypothetical protein
LRRVWSGRGERWILFSKNDDINRAFRKYNR